MIIYAARNPASTANACPVTKEAASEQSQTTASPTSCGLPQRFMALPRASDIIIGCFSSRLAIGVLTPPGQTALMRMPDLAYSSAAVRVSSMTPPLEAQ